MARPVIPAAILAQRGVTIHLIDGPRRLCYTFSSLMRLEEDFGSIGAAIAAVSSGTDGQAIGSTARLLAAGLEHEVYEHGERLSDVDIVRYLIDSTRIEEYGDAIGEAFNLAFPSNEEEDDAGDPPVAATTASPGLSGTTSAPSSSDGQTPSSGA